MLLKGDPNYALVIGLPGKGDPGLPGGNQLKLEKSAPQYLGLSGLLAFILPEDWGHFQASVGGCHCLC